MGIKNLKALLDKHPSSFQKVPLKTFSGKRVAIDAENVLIRSITSIWPRTVDRTNYPHESPNLEQFVNNWLAILRRDIERFLINGVTPVYVFDGIAPIEKRECQIKRASERKENQKKLDGLIEKALQMRDVPLSVKREIRTVAKKIFPYDYSPGERGLPSEVSEDDQNINLKDIMRSLYLSIGVPVIDCLEESERLCANLCLEGYCSATFSSDRDVLVHGCPILITEFCGPVRNEKNVELEGVTVIILHKVLSGLELSFPKFVDVCIMLGCDYNTNIGNIGAIKSYNFIKKYGKIENIPIEEVRKPFETYLKTHPELADYLDNPITILKHEACRRLFQRKPSKEMVRGELFILNLNKDCLKTTAPQHLSMYGLHGWITTLINLYSFMNQLPEKDHCVILPPTYHDGGKTKLTLMVIPKLSVTV